MFVPPEERPGALSDLRWRGLWLANSQHGGMLFEMHGAGGPMLCQICHGVRRLSRDEEEGGRAESDAGPLVPTELPVRQGLFLHGTWAQADPHRTSVLLLGASGSSVPDL